MRSRRQSPSGGETLSIKEETVRHMSKHLGRAGALLGALLAMTLAGKAAAASYDNCPPARLPSGYDWTAVKDALEDSPFQRGGLIIYHKGQVVYWSGFGWWDGQDCETFVDNHNFNVASLSKTYTAALAFAVIEDQHVGLSLNDLVKDYIPNATSLNSSTFDDSGTPRLVYDHMTIDDLITMTTGHESVSAWPANLFSCINNPFVSFEDCGEEMVAADIADDPDHADRVYAPGDAFSYGPMSWQILGLVLVNAVNDAYSTNYSFTDLVENYLTGSGVCNFPNTTVTRSGNEWPAGGFETDLFDGGAFAQALLSGQCGSSHVLLNATSRADMTEVMVPLQSGRCDGVGNCEPVPVVSSPTKKLSIDYARGQWVFAPEDLSHSTIYMGVGAWGAVTFYSPERDWAAYIHLDDHLLSGYQDAVELIINPRGLAELIDDQVDANP